MSAINTPYIHFRVDSPLCTWGEGDTTNLFIFSLSQYIGCLQCLFLLGCAAAHDAHDTCLAYTDVVE